MGLKCPECGAGADLTKDGEWAHCASCNNIFQPKDVESKDKGEGDGEEAGESTKDDGGKGEETK